MTNVPSSEDVYVADAEAAGAVGELAVIGSTNAFATVIDAYRITDHETLNAALLELILPWQERDEGVAASNVLGWHSSRDVLRRSEPPYEMLRRYVMQGLTHSIRRYWENYDPERDLLEMEGWANVNGKGAFNAPHNHADNHLSGVYYVATPPATGRSGAIEFMNPGGSLNSLLAFGERLIRSQVRVAPQAGQMLIFPSHLRHWVYPNQEDAARVSIAFNVRVLATVLR